MKHKPGMLYAGVLYVEVIGGSLEELLAQRTPGITRERAVRYGVSDESIPTLAFAHQLYPRDKNDGGCSKHQYFVKPKRYPRQTGPRQNGYHGHKIPRHLRKAKD